MRPGFELLEHTADVGIRSWGCSVEQAFEQAGWGMVEVLGIQATGPGEEREIRATGSDEEALLVDFLNEVLLVHETEEVAVADIRVLSVSGTELEATLVVRPLTGPPDGVPVKAATFHQLRVERGAEGRVEAQVYLDV